MRSTKSLLYALILLPLMPALGVAAEKADLKAAKKNYDNLCAVCHGTTGKGAGPAAAALNATKPRDLTDCKMMVADSD